MPIETTNEQIECYRCGTLYPANTIIECEGDYLCVRCTAGYTSFCGRCENYFYDDHYTDSDYHSCSDNSENSINDYHYHKSHTRPVFYGGRNGVDTFYGVELEVECDYLNKSCSEIASLILKDNTDYIYCESDSSLTNGFEIVSQPMTLDYIQTSKIWDKVSKVGIKEKCRSHDTTTCGLHVHISRTGFENDSHLKKFLIFWYSQDRIVTSIARRDYSHYCQKKNIPERKIPTKSFITGRDRYEQVNLTNENTVEIRRFKGTLNPVSIMACIELCDASRVYCNKKKYEEMHDYKTIELDFLTWIMKKSKTYPNLTKKIQEKITFNLTSE